MEDNFYGSADALVTVKDFARKWSFAILIILIIGIVFNLYYFMMRKETMYNPGATAWFQLGNWKENMIDPANLDCAAVGTNTLDSDDPYRDYAATAIAENFSDAQLAKGLFTK